MKDLAKTKASCYCGKSENQKEKLICCVKCKRWLHADCIKCLDKETLYGDRFYILVCSVCNSGSEFLARLEFTWTELIHLVLYHLTIVHRQKYFNLDHMILPFFLKNWDNLNLFGAVQSTKKEHLHTRISEILESNSVKFKSGKEIKKSKNIWALRIKAPPEAPSVQSLSAKLQNDRVIWEFQVKDRKYHILNKLTKNCSSSFKNGKAKSKHTVNSRSRLKQNNVTKCRGGLPYNDNGIQKAKNKTKSTISVVFNEESAKIGLLDSLIPYPPNFHPFQKPKENFDKRENSKNSNNPNKRPLDNDTVDVKTERSKRAQICRDKTISSPVKSDKLFSAKDFFSDPELAKNFSLCIIGKRITKSGHVQYLFQRNREIKETAPVEKLSQIKFLCTCPNCKQ